MVMQSNYSYQAALEASERIGWRVEDIIGGEKHLDFTKPFMPESLAQVKQLTFLTPAEQRTLNQIRGHEYLAMFGLVEEFILPYVVDHARSQLSGDDYRVRALLQFAGEEAKHIQLFKRFRQEFEAGFGSKCDFIGPAEDVKRFVLSHSPLGVGIAVLHIEWMTLRHYVEGFVSATSRNLSKSQREEMTAAVLKGMRWTYLGTGMTHPNFLATVEKIKPEARKQIEEMAPAFC